jgi:hypothetical protein
MLVLACCAGAAAVLGYVLAPRVGAPATVAAAIDAQTNGEIKILVAVSNRSERVILSDSELYCKLWKSNRLSLITNRCAHGGHGLRAHEYTTEEVVLPPDTISYQAFWRVHNASPFMRLAVFMMDRMLSDHKLWRGYQLGYRLLEALHPRWVPAQPHWEECSSAIMNIPRDPEKQ